MWTLKVLPQLLPLQILGITADAEAQSLPLLLNCHARLRLSKDEPTDSEVLADGARENRNMKLESVVAPVPGEYLTTSIRDTAVEVSTLAAACEIVVLSKLLAMPPAFVFW